MSQQIICNECDFANAPGSKFCSNCGAKLPLGTHHICNNCGTSNPIDRVFCDTCGTRLIPEEPRPETKTPPSEPAPSAKAFSLPTRRPGDTGDLDPRNVPDWLKTGETRKTSELSEPEEEAEAADLPEAEALPRVEELVKKKQTADLPDWLVDEEDSDPIIHAPTIISTEFYKDLLDRQAEDLPQPDELFADEETDLPDWLKEAGESGSVKRPSAESKPAKPAPPEPKGLTEFLENLPDEHQGPPLHDKKDSGSLTSWLAMDAGADDEDTPADAPDDTDDSLTNWLSEGIEASEPAASGAADDADTGSLTNWLTDTDEDDFWGDAAEPSAPDSDSLTNWLEDKRFAEDAEEEVAAGSQEMAPELADSLTGWLSDLPDEVEETAVAGQADTGGLTEWLEDKDEGTAADNGQEIAPELARDLTGWLSELPEEDEMAQADDLLADWFTDEDDLEDESQLSEADDFDLSNRLSDWLSGGEEPVEDQPEAGTATADEDEEVITDLEADDLLSAWFTDEQSEAEDKAPLSDADRLAAWVAGADTPESKEKGSEFEWLEDPTPPIVKPGTGPLPEEYSWLDETEEELASIFQSQPSIEEELPDWLANVAAEGETLLTDEEAAADDLYDAERLAAETEIDWLHETGSLTLDKALSQELGLDKPEPADDIIDDLIQEDEPDWLADLEAMGTGDLPPLEELDEAEETPVPPAAAPARPPEPAFAAAEAPESQPADSETWGTEDEMPAFATDEEALPDWMSRLDALSEADEEDSLIPSDELPDWVASLRPSRDLTDSVLPGALIDDIPETLAGIPEELASSDLPDWLQDIPSSTEEPAALPAASSSLPREDIPDWLQEGLDLDEEKELIDEGVGSALLDSTPGIGADEWANLLDGVGPEVAYEETLAKAEIPDWVMNLKPAELTGEQPKARVPEGPEETLGPLSGLRGVVTVEPVIAVPHVAGPIQSFTISPEQQKQAALLRQLTHPEFDEETAVGGAVSRDIARLLRPLFALILLGVMIVGLRTSVVPASLPAAVSPALDGFNTAVAAAAGQNVLLAFEYTPAMAGELSPEAQTVLAQLATNDATLFTLSQHTTGVALAADLAFQSEANVVDLGYLPGGPVGLRQLAQCLHADGRCQAGFGATLSAAEKSRLADIALVIVLTADRQSLINWIEQVGTPSRIPVIAGVTQSLAPLAAPYYQTGQLAGVLNGLPDTAVYQQVYLADASLETEAAYTQELFQAQVAAQLLLIVTLILGALLYIITGIWAQRRSKK